MSDWEIRLSEQEFARLRAVGYWHSAAQPELPDPAAYVDATWSEAERRATLEYLRSVPSCARYCGYSTCRLCGKTGRELGDADLTDGIWIWPEGLAHYLERHSVCPPADFLLSLRGNGFRQRRPILPVETTVSRLEPKLLLDMERTEDATTVRFRLARVARRRDIYLGVEVDKQTGSFRLEINEAILRAQQQRVAQAMNPPRWRRIVRALIGL